MDMFIRLFDTETNEMIFLNKNDIEFISVAEADLIAGLTMRNAYVLVHFKDKDGVKYFMRGIEGLIGKVPHATVTIKNRERGEE